MEKARIIVLTGSGKGKTTSAVGMILRAVAYGKTVLLIRFCKTAFSGELAILETLPGVAIRQGSCGMTPPPDHPQYGEHVQCARALFAATEEAAPGFDMIVMDEICGVTARNMIDEVAVVKFLLALRTDQTCILTGRGAGPAIIDVADTVSEIQCVKHGYQAGISAQEGVEK